MGGKETCHKKVKEEKEQNKVIREKEENGNKEKDPQDKRPGKVLYS